MGFVLLGIYSGNPLALQGATMEIIAHGISTGALFLLAGMLQERTHTRDFRKLGGLWATTPKMGGFTLLFALVALGLPGLGNFVGEFLVLLGVFQVNPVISIIGTLGFVFSVVYALRLVQGSMQGPNANNWTLPDLNPREIAILGVLAVVIIWFGLTRSLASLLLPISLLSRQAAEFIANMNEKRNRNRHQCYRCLKHSKLPIYEGPASV